MEKMQKAADYIRKRLGDTSETCVVLGSGFSKIAEHLSDGKELSYGDIPGFPVSTVAGHSGKLLSGALNGKNVLIFSGRFHYYEGYSMEEIAFPIRVLKLLGVKNLILTNATGGIRESFKAGDLVLISDHIKFFDQSPLYGRNLDAFGERFPDMTYAYDRELRGLAMECAKNIGIALSEGVYAFMPGPGYETPAEIRALRILGADIVGMSTVPEVITAVHCKMKVLGISCVCNLAAGILDEPLAHEDVIAAGVNASDKAVALLKEILKHI